MKEKWFKNVAFWKSRGNVLFHLHSLDSGLITRHPWGKKKKEPPAAHTTALIKVDQCCIITTAVDRQEDEGYFSESGNKNIERNAGG